MKSLHTVILKLKCPLNSQANIKCINNFTATALWAPLFVVKQLANKML